MNVFRVAVAVCVVLMVGVVGCKKKETPAPQSQQMPSGHPPVGGAPAGGAPMSGSALSGKVVETMNSGGYTYVNLESEGKRTWVALPDSKVKVGQQITCQPGMAMQNFKSKTLNRTFDVIIFSGGIM